MNNSTENPRITLLRESAIFQLKLIADGLRDAALIPIALIASLIGLIRGGPDADTEFRKVIRVGRKTERWINLFGNQRPLGFTNPAGSMDRVLNQVESIVTEQYQKGTSAAELREAVRKSVRKATGEEQTGPAKGGQ